MNDFLTSLAARTLGTIPVLVPRPPTRFEPVPPDSGAAFREIQAEANSTNPRPHVTSATSGLHAADTQPEPNSRRPAPPRPPVTPDSAPTFAFAPSPAGHDANTPAAPQPAVPRTSDPPARAGTTPSDIRPRQPSLAPFPTPRPGRRPDAHRESRNSAPAIHISIGRVEVRAIHRAAPAPPSPKIPPSPRRSLEEYLRPGRG